MRPRAEGVGAVSSREVLRKNKEKSIIGSITNPPVVSNPGLEDDKRVQNEVHRKYSIAKGPHSRHTQKHWLQALHKVVREAYLFSIELSYQDQGISSFPLSDYRRGCSGKEGR